MFGRRYELSIDANNLRAASANYTDGVVTIWDLANPVQPTLQHSIPTIATIVSLRSPSPNSASTLFMGMIGWTRSARTFEVDDGGPEEFEADYWSDTSLAHNDLPTCGFENGGVLSSDGSVLFLSRNAIHQVFDLSDCLRPTPAVASLAVTPDPAFPGDTVTVRDTSTGRVDRWAVWVTEGPSPAGTPLPPGTSPTPSTSNPHDVNFVIPQDLPVGDEYWAHIEVEADDLVPADPDYDVEININRAPQASITVTPAAVVVGESVTLTATAEGHPDVDPYSWTIVKPSGGTIDRSGISTSVVLDEVGDWDFSLTVDYQHGATVGTYQASAAITDFTVISVAADFTISPASPLQTQNIVLDGSISKPVGGNLSYEWAVESVSYDYTGCPATQVCTIPADSLLPDTTYNVTLTVTNEDDGAIDVTAKPLPVGNGTVLPTISFTPTNPETGQSVLFAIDGVQTDIDKAYWSMGGSGCAGADPTPECIPSLWNDCRYLSYQYAISSTKTVNLTVEVGGNFLTAPPATITVAPGALCPGDSAILEDGFESGDLWAWSSD
jgi:hypothetical protein